MSNKTEIAELRLQLNMARENWISEIKVSPKLLSKILDQFEAAEARIAELEGAVDTWRKESAYNLQGKNDAKEYARELEDINERHQNRVAVLECKLEYAEAEIAALRGRRCRFIK